MQPVNKQAVAQAFSRAATHYNQHADLQRRSGAALLALAPHRPGAQLLDAGCGTGWFSQFWRQRGHQVTALDLSAAMLQQARQQQAADRYLLGDIDALPIASDSMDLVWSNLAVQWSSNLRAALRQFVRVTRPGGAVLFSTLTAGSLQELHDAWRYLDTHPHANRFLTAAQIRAACGDLNVRLQQQTITLYFPDALSAMRSLKGIGATHLHQGRDNTMLTRQRLAQLEQHWARDAQGCRLSYQLMYGVIYK